MGYTTQFGGHVTVEPPLTQEQQIALREFAGMDHRYEEGVPGNYCQWIPSKDGARIYWDGGEKFHSSVEWMEYVIKHFVPAGSKVNGVIDAAGEDPSDVWRLVVTDNVVTVQQPQWG